MDTNEKVPRILDEAYWTAQPELTADEQATLAGCTSTWNAWTGKSSWSNSDGTPCRVAPEEEAKEQADLAAYYLKHN